MAALIRHPIFEERHETSSKQNGAFLSAQIINWRAFAQKHTQTRASVQRWSYRASIAFIGVAGVLGWAAIIGVVALAA